METFANFQALLLQIRELLMQENSCLKSGNLSGHSALMQKKKELLQQLDTALQELKAAPSAKTSGQPREQLRALQDKIMQLLMLDKENEALLSQRSMGSPSAGVCLNSAALEKLCKNV